jgi:hypothetical protein
LHGRRLAPDGCVRSIDRHRPAVPTELPFDIPDDQLDREKVGDGAEMPVVFEVGEVGKGHPRPQLDHAPIGEPALLHEIGPVLEDRIREQLAPRDLNPELALQAEDDVEEFDLLRPQISLQGGGGDDVVFRDAQRLHQHSRDPRMNLVCVRHGLVPSREN